MIIQHKPYQSRCSSDEAVLFESLAHFWSPLIELTIEYGRLNTAAAAVRIPL